MGLYIRIYEYDLTTDAWYVVSLSMNSLTSSFCSKLDFMKILRAINYEPSWFLNILTFCSLGQNHRKLV